MSVIRILVLFASLVGVGMALVVLRTDTRQSRYVASRLQDRQQDVKRRCLELELKMARLRNPLRLDTANERFGLRLEPLPAPGLPLTRGRSAAQQAGPVRSPTIPTARDSR